MNLFSKKQFEKTAECDSPCPGDPTQMCGGVGTDVSGCGDHLSVRKGTKERGHNHWQ